MGRGVSNLIVVLLLVGATAVARAEPAASPCIGKKLAKAPTIVACTNFLCQEEGFEAKLVSLTGLEEGKPVTQDALDKATARLGKTGFFSDVSLACEVVDTKASVSIILDDLPLVKEVEIGGNSYFYDSEIKRRLFIHKGTILGSTDEPLEDVLGRQEDSIRRLYQKEGFNDTEVTISLDKLEANLVLLRVTIVEGTRLKIDTIEFDFGTLTAKDSGLCPHFYTKNLEHVFGLDVGDTYTDKVVKKAKEKLRDELRKYGIVGVKVTHAYDETAAKLTVTVEHEGCMGIRFFMVEEELDGSLAVDTDTSEELFGVLPFKESGVFDWTEAEIGRIQLIERFLALGYFFVDVKLEFRTFDEDEVQGGLVGMIDYYIEPGEIAEVREITIHGTDAVDEDELLGLMQTHTWDFFEQGGYLLIEQMMGDLELIKEYYLKKGFYDFHFQGASYTEALDVKVTTYSGKTVYDYKYEDKAFTVTKYTDDPAMYLSFGVVEGSRCKVKTVAFKGLAAIPDSMLDESLVLKSGTYYSDDLLKKDLTALKNLYLSLGYPQVKVDVECAYPSGDACYVEDVRGDKVHLQFVVEEGVQAKVGEIFWYGNFRTEDDYILSRFPKTGDVLDATKISKGLTFLRNSGIFVTVTLDTIGLEEKPPREEVALVLRIEEDGVRFIDVAGGFETINRETESASDTVTSLLGTGIDVVDSTIQGAQGSFLQQLPDLLIVGQVGYLDRNFLGTAKELVATAKYGLSTTEIMRYTSLSVGLTDYHFSALDIQMTIRPFFVIDQVSQYIVDTWQGGVQFQLSRQLFEKLFGTISFEVGAIKIRDLTKDDPTFEPWAIQSKVIPRVTLDMTDNPINPMSGVFANAAFSYINAYDFIENQFTNFVKIDLTTKIYLNIRKKVVFAVLLHYGTSAAFGSDDLPLNERYKLGGSKGLRGFGDDAVSQYNASGGLKVRKVPYEEGSDDVPCLDDPDNPIVYEYIAGGDMILNGTFELRFPIMESIGLWGAAFTDMGALSESWGELTWPSFRQSYGIGLRWLIGGQIPLRLDYGFKVKQRCLDIDSCGVCTAKESAGNIHFGILYTF